jgi:hypothetical protein
MEQTLLSDFFVVIPLIPLDSGADATCDVTDVQKNPNPSGWDLIWLNQQP